MTEDKMMRKMIILVAISLAAVFFAACGDETAGKSSSQQYQQPNGTVINRRIGERPNQMFQLQKFKKKWQLPPLNIQTWPMVATGQTQCFDNKKEVDCSQVTWEYEGQDGKNHYGTRSLTKEYNNEIVRDSVTSLLWTKRVSTDLTWYEANAYCESLRLNNKTWRLPTTAELRSIVNYGKVNPAIDPVFYEDSQGRINTEEALELKEQLVNWFWATKHVYFDSETPVSSNRPLASSWIINFYDGFVEYTSRYNTYNVRCVSSEF